MIKYNKRFYCKIFQKKFPIKYKYQLAFNKSHIYIDNGNKVEKVTAYDIYLNKKM